MKPVPIKFKKENIGRNLNKQEKSKIGLRPRKLFAVEFSDFGN